MKDKALPRIIDLGCGPQKVEGAYGVDCHPYEGVDKVFDLDSIPWPLAPDSFDCIYARHVIEHVKDVKDFMNEIHRVSMDGAIVEIVTPHFSSLDSWQDPTHRWHLSCKWYKPFTSHYLSEQILSYEHVSTAISYPRKTICGLIIRFMIWSKLKTLGWWERKHAFVHRAGNITTRLRVNK